MKTTAMLILGAVTLSACGGPEHEAGTPSASAPEHPHTVAAEHVAATVAVQGTVHARERAEISTRLMARVAEVPVDLGGAVRAGHVVVRLGLDDVEASRAKAEAAVTVARAARDEAARHAARMDTLLAADAVARVQRDQAHLGLAQAESQLAMALATSNEVETAAGYARIEAPFDGVVVARSVDPGDLAAPGAPLLSIERAGPRDAVLAVPPELAAALPRAAQIEVTTADGRSTTGRVRVVSGGADPMTRTVEVRVELPADWPTGASVTALVPAGERAAVMIPTEYVVRRGQLTGVHVVDGGTRLLRWVRLGRADGAQVEVLAGLTAGEVISR